MKNTKQKIKDLPPQAEPHQLDAPYKSLIEIGYEQVMKELKEEKNPTGRPRKMTLEMFRDYHYWLRATGSMVYAAEMSRIGEKRRQSYSAESETFRGLSWLSKNSTRVRARMNLDAAINIGDVETSLNFLKMVGVFKDEKEIEEANTTPIHAPQNEREAELLLKLMNKHHDYVESKRGSEDS